MEMGTQARREIVLEVARLFHLKDYIKSQRGKRVAARAKIPWAELGQDDLGFYVKKVQPVLDTILAAGFVILKQSEVSQAYRPLREQQIVRPVIRLPTSKDKRVYPDRAQQQRERRR